MSSLLINKICFCRILSTDFLNKIYFRREWLAALTWIQSSSQNVYLGKSASLSPNMQKFHKIPDWDSCWYTDQLSYQARNFSCNQLLWLYVSTSRESKTIHKTRSRNSSLSIYFKISFRLFVDYHHLKNYCFICKIIIRGYFI